MQNKFHMLNKSQSIIFFKKGEWQVVGNSDYHGNEKRWKIN